MKKTVSIQEAIKANEHSRVRRLNYSCNYPWYKVGELHNSKLPICVEDILAEWEIEEKPLEVWCNVYYGSNINFSYHEIKEDADTYHKSNNRNRIRCVKMREVMDDTE